MASVNFVLCVIKSGELRVCVIILFILLLEFVKINIYS